MRAVLTIRPFPGVAGTRELEVDCRHGTTRVFMIQPAGVVLDEALAIRLALAEHDAQEGCGCTASLWAKYSGTSRN
jgi:hypothetical protein